MGHDAIMTGRMLLTFAERPAQFGRSLFSVFLPVSEHGSKRFGHDVWYFPSGNVRLVACQRLVNNALLGAGL
jgi:hypothetical protein